MFTEQQKRLLDRLSQVNDIEWEIVSLFEKTNHNIQELNDSEQALARIIDQKRKGFPGWPMQLLSCTR